MDNNGIYIVLSINDSAVEVCDVYSDPQIASYRAVLLAKDNSTAYPEWVDQNPSAEKLNNGTVRWKFLETSRRLVVMFLKHMFEPIKAIHGNLPPPPSPIISSSITSDDLIKMLQSQVAPTVTIKDDPYDRSLPGGFTHSNKAVDVGFMIDHEDEVQSVSSLSYNQQLALTKARISKRPHYNLYVFGYGNFNQAQALEAIKANGVEASAIISKEILLLDDFLDSFKEIED